MKKKLFLISLIGLICATSAYAACEGGTEITNTLGTTFCKSNVSMNWWSLRFLSLVSSQSLTKKTSPPIDERTFLLQNFYLIFESQTAEVIKSGHFKFIRI